MRRSDGLQEALFTVAKLEDFGPADHPLRPISTLVNDALGRMGGLFKLICADTGRAPIAPESLLRAMLIQIFFAVRSERQLMEQVRYNLLYHWFIGLAIDGDVWDHSTFSKNRNRLLEHEVAESFFTEVMTLADKRQLLSKERFSVDGTLIQAWASHQSFVPKDGRSDDANGGGAGARNTQANLKGKPRSNDTHENTTDPDARLFRKSHNTAAIMSYQGHVLMEKCSGLVVGAVVTHADGRGREPLRWRCSTPCLALMPRRSPRTRPMTRATSSTHVASAALRCTWQATTGALAAVRLTGAQHDTPDTRSAKRFESESSSTSVGAKRWARFDKPCTGESNGSISTSSSR